MRYRAEIDGLRAVAVLPVILFHAGFQQFSGGYVGVDVFFVISGYLITSIILVEKQAGTFSLINFYERRMRRILPALFFVMLACIPFAWLWLTPNNFRYFSQSVLSVTVFLSNVYFWLRSGYFDLASEFKPLLHTWSLAVEEQYYLVFPLFILLMWKLGRGWIFGLLVIFFAGSLALAEWSAYNNTSANFYLAPMRAWELALGSFTALYFTGRWFPSISDSTHQILSGTGILLIAFAVFTFTKNTPFPGLYALVPTVGTVLVILFTTPKTIVGAILGSKILVGIGLISYSAYLWHQPLLAFARNRLGTGLSLEILMGLCLATMGLAYLSWRFIEQPFRSRDRIARKQLFILAFCSTVAFGLFGAAIHLQTIATIAALQLKEGWVFKIDYRSIQKKTASVITPLAKQDINETFPAESADKIKILILGDSIADDLVAAAKLSKRVQAKFSIQHLDYDDACFSADRPFRCEQALANYSQSRLPGDADFIILNVGFDRYSELDRFLAENNSFKRKLHVILPATFNDPTSLRYPGASLPPKTDQAALAKIYAQNKFETQITVNKNLAHFLEKNGVNHSDGYKIHCQNVQSYCALVDKSGNILMYDGLHKTAIGLHYFSSRVEDWLFSNFSD